MIETIANIGSWEIGGEAPKPKGPGSTNCKIIFVLRKDLTPQTSLDIVGFQEFLLGICLFDPAKANFKQQWARCFDVFYFR